MAGLIRRLFRRDLRLRTSPRARRSRRIVLESRHRSNRDNHRAGDVMELRWLSPDAKPFIGWWDYTDPDNPSCKAWMGAHDLANDADKAPHRHWSIEVPGTDGHMQTRLAVAYDRDHTTVSINRADLQINGQGVLRMGRWRVARDGDDLVVDRRKGKDVVEAARFCQDGTVEVTGLAMRDEATGRVHRIAVRDGQVVATEEAVEESAGEPADEPS